MKQLMVLLSKALFRGLLIIVPAYLAILLLLKAMQSVANLVRPFTQLLPDWIPAQALLSLLLILALCLVVGASVGTRTGKPPTSRSCSRRASPPTIAQTSVEVPPMSKARAFSTPASRATRAAPTTPAAGPESSARAAWAAASSSGATPPDERMINGTGSPTSSHRAARARR